MDKSKAITEEQLAVKTKTKPVLMEATASVVEHKSLHRHLPCRLGETFFHPVNTVLCFVI